MKGLPMNSKWVFYVLVVTILAGGELSAQRRRMGPPPENPSPERFEKFKKMRLVEELDLKEDDAVKFFAKQNAHEDKVREMMRARNEILDGMEESVKDQNDAKELQQKIDRVIDLDQAIFAERRRYQDELRQFLPPDKFGRFLAFERDFGRQVRDAVGNIYREKRKRMRED